MGGKTKNPTYEDVCSHTTGHAETVKVTFDPAKTTYGELLKAFFKFHDPTQLNRQGPDIGDSYRSAIFTTDSAQLEQANKFIDELSKSERYGKRKIVTQVVPAENIAFYPAEDYHQDYHLKHGGSCPMPND
jgi:methionine-S-sulfoxide reductase